jgi:hypothetical protein
VGQRQQFLETVIGQSQHLEHLVSGESFAALEHLLAGLDQHG